LPVCDRRLATQAKTDRDRLQQQQLVYTGVQRTAVASILSRVSVAGQPCPLVAETFATSDDAYLVLGLTEESATDCNTADGRPRTLACARARLSRMIGEDFERLSDKIVHSMAQQIVDAQAELVAAAIIRNCQQVTTDRACHILVAGHGAALLREAVARLPFATHTTWLSELVSADAARSAPAVAVAWLLAHHLAVDAA
jgi:probable H4MPT-linked C1 transfer pathway protein